MKKFTDWWKQDRKYVLLIKALLMALLPFLCCVVTCAAAQKSIGEVYLPASEWNDELFYYKQVESIVEFGYPYGYYGFNESHGRVLSFAAWSPVLVLPWIVWGLLFGWNLMSPIICNILLMMVSMFLFVWLVKPNGKQLGILTLLFCLYTPFVRYMLSGMPEIICISHLIVFYGVVISYERKPCAGKLVAEFALAGLLTLMRPYMLLFLLLPAFCWIRDAGKKGHMWTGILGSGVVMGAILTCYAMIKHFFGAEYFHPLFFTDWLTTFFTDGFGAGVKNFFGTLYWKGKDCYAHMVQGLRTGLASGTFFAGFLTIGAVLLAQSAVDCLKYRRNMVAGQKREEKREEPVESAKGVLLAEAHLAFSFVGMFFAILLMYKLTEGSKHLLTFMAVAVFVISLMETKAYKKAVFVGAVFAFLYTYRAVDPYDFQVPYVTEGRAAQVEDWRERFAGAMELTMKNVPNYDNAVIWVFNEVGEDQKAMKWQLLYSLPEGFGISCCQKDFVLSNFDRLHCRYYVVQSGAEVDKRCREEGLKELSRDHDIVLYQRY